MFQQGWDLGKGSEVSHTGLGPAPVCIGYVRFLQLRSCLDTEYSALKSSLSEGTGRCVLVNRNLDAQRIRLEIPVHILSLAPVSVCHRLHCIFFFNFRGERGRRRGRKRERERNIALLCCSTFYLCNHWLNLAYALTRHGNRDLGVSGPRRNRLSSRPGPTACTSRHSSLELPVSWPPALTTGPCFSITLDANTPRKGHS